MNEYRYTLTNLLTLETKVLTEPPKEWNKMTRLFKRSKTYNSIFRELTSPVIFPRVGSEQEDKAGYYFIINALESTGPKTQMSFKREKRNPRINDYEDDGIWQMDFDPEGGVPRTIDDVTIEMTDSSKLAKVMARDEIDVNVFSTTSLDNVAIIPFSFSYQEATYPPIDIYLECTFTAIFSGSIHATNDPDITGYAYLYGTTDINEIGDRITLDSAPSSDKMFYENTLEQITQFNLTELSGQSNHIIDIVVPDPDPVTGTEWTYKAYIVAEYENGAGVYSTDEVLVVDLSGIGNYNTRTEIDYDTFPVVSGDIVWTWWYNLYMRVEVRSEEPFVSVDSIISTAVLTSDSYEKTDGEPENDIRGFLADEYFTRLLQLYTSELDTTKILRSNFLGRTDSQFMTYSVNGDGSGLFNTNGVQLRRLTNKALNGNLKDAFRSYDAMNALGMGYDPINDVFFIEPIEEFYKDEAFPFTIEDVTDLETTFSKEYYWNSFLGGYPKVEYEDFQGVNEYNTQREYSSFVTSKTKIDKRSRANGDSIGAELARRYNETRFRSRDTRYDEQNFIHDTSNLTVITNDDTLGHYSGFKGIGLYYNPGFTPRQNALKHTGLLSAEFWSDTLDNINFRSAQKDTDISYLTYPLGVFTEVDEFSDIEQSEMLTPFIVPDVYKFKGAITSDMIDEIKSDPHRYIPFTDVYGDTYYGYILEIEVNDYEGTGVFKLIRANINR